MKKIRAPASYSETIKDQSNVLITILTKYVSKGKNNKRLKFCNVNNSHFDIFILTNIVIISRPAKTKTYILNNQDFKLSIFLSYRNFMIRK